MFVVNIQPATIDNKAKSRRAAPVPSMALAALGRPGRRAGSSERSGSGLKMPAELQWRVESGEWRVKKQQPSDGHPGCKAYAQGDLCPLSWCRKARGNWCKDKKGNWCRWRRV